MDSYDSDSYCNGRRCAARGPRVCAGILGNVRQCQVGSQCQSECELDGGGVRVSGVSRSLEVRVSRVVNEGVAHSVPIANPSCSIDSIPAQEGDLVFGSDGHCNYVLAIGESNAGSAGNEMIRDFVRGQDEFFNHIMY